MTKLRIRGIGTLATLVGDCPTERERRRRLHGYRRRARRHRWRGGRGGTFVLRRRSVWRSSWVGNRCIGLRKCGGRDSEGGKQEDRLHGLRSLPVRFIPEGHRKSIRLPIKNGSAVVRLSDPDTPLANGSKRRFPAQKQAIELHVVGSVKQGPKRGSRAHTHRH